MANGLVFPVKFDLQKAVTDASGDVDKILRRLETQIDSRPLTIKPKIDDSALRDLSDRLKKLSIPSVTIGSGDSAFTAAEGSITALSDAMQKCIAEWNQLSESERIVNRESGEYTEKAKQIISRFSELTAASSTFAKTLQQVARESKTAADAEIKRNQKAAEQVATMSSQERTLDQVNSKVKILSQLMKGLDGGDEHWKNLAGNLERINQKQTEMQAVQKAELAQLQSERDAVNQLVASLQNYGGTIGQIQTKLSAFKSTLSKTSIGGDAFRELALQIKAMNEELQRANQLSQNYQAKSLRGVNSAVTDEAVRKMESLQARIRQIDAQMNLAHAKGQDMGSYQMIKLLQERIELEATLKNIMSSGADVAKQKLDAEIAAQTKLIEAAAKRADEYNRQRQREAEAKEAQRKKDEEDVRRERQANEARKRILSEQVLSYDTLAQKIQILETARNKTDIGSARWARLTKEIDKTRESLKAITNEMNKSATWAERIARLREILSASERSMSGLTGKLAEYNAQLQRLEVGSEKFNKTALNVARLNEELSKISQYSQDFAQKAFEGLSDNLTKDSVEKLTQLREELRKLDADFNKLNQQGGAYLGDGSLSTDANNILRKRQKIAEEINRTLTTAAEAQLQREKEINRVVEQRKAKTTALANKRKAEQAAIRANVAMMKEERRILNQQESSISAITAKLQIQRKRLESTNLNGSNFAKIAKEVERLTKKLEEARKKMAQLSGQKMSTKNVRKVTEEYSKQFSYIDRLVRRMAVYASVGAIGNFLTKLREVTAQFELQRISLGAILQDQNKANLLFSEIKAFALKSPVSILDLTKYTKQLAAYKIGYEDLFDTTKRLTDISVGLGVSMDRIILMYGQIRATGYLRASEVRQATEAGIPLVESLAQKLSETNGELVRASDVMDMISKRQISFEQVKEVFEDMTSAGGMFYNMQEKQGNTLFGMWAKLGDAISIMYDEIGNTSVINGAMKIFIELATILMRNWRFAVGELAVAALGFGALRVSQNLTTASTVAASKAVRDYARAQAQLNAVQKRSDNGFAKKMAEKSAEASMRAAKANRVAAMSTNLWTAAKFKLVAVANSLKATIMGNWLTLAITLIAAVVTAIGAAVESATRLSRKLNELKAETLSLQDQSVHNFEHLAKTATQAVDGSKKQKDALSELARTYRDMLPEEALRIENLEKLEGNYRKLTQAIRENIAAQQADKMRSAIEENLGAEITKQTQNLRKLLTRSELVGGYGFSDSEAEQFLLEFQERVRKAGKITYGMMSEINEQLNLGMNRGQMTRPSQFGVPIIDPNYFKKLADAIKEREDRLRGVSEWEEQAARNLKGYEDAMKSYDKAVAKNMATGETMLQNQQNVNMQIKLMGGVIQRELREVGIAWKNEWANILQDVNPAELNKTTTLNMKAILDAIDPNEYPELHNFVETFRDMYDELVPPSPTVQQIRANLFAVAESADANIDKLKRFLWDGSNSVEEHLKTLKEQSEIYKAQIQELQTTEAKKGWMGSIANFLFKGKIEETEKLLEAVNKQIEFVQQYLVTAEQTPKSGGSGSVEDPWIVLMKNRIKFMQDFQKGVENLSKTMGSSKGLADEQENMLGRGLSLKIDSRGLNGTKEELIKWYEDSISEVRKRISKLGGKEWEGLGVQMILGKDTKNKVLKKYQELLADMFKQLTDFRTEQTQRAIESKIKQLADNISRTKTAKEFYDKILAQTGDQSLASTIADSIFGQTGDALQRALANQVKGLTNGIELPEGIISADNIVNYKALRSFAEDNKSELGKMYDELVKISEQGQKDIANTYEGYLKDLEVAKTYADKRIELARNTANKIAEIEKSNLPQAEKERLSNGYKDRESKEVAKLEYDAFKDTPMYVQMFDDLNSASTTMLRNMQNMLTRLKGQWGDSLAPTELKEMQNRLNEIGEQLAQRNPFKAIGDGVKKIRELNEQYGSLGEAEKKLTTETNKLLLAKADLTTALQAETNARAEYDKAVKENGKDSKVAKDAKSNLSTATATVQMMKKAVNLSEKETALLQNIIGLFQDAEDEIEDGVEGLGKYVSLITEAQNAVKNMVEDWSSLGDDELWNTIFSGLDKMAQSATQAGDAVASYRSGDYFGAVTKGISSIASLVSGIGNLIYGSKVAKANKEIKKQSEILDELQYAYERLEATADKLFGADYTRNYNQRLRSLAAQQEAYLKQAEAERSKGKKEDKAKTKEYEDQARETADAIKDMQDELLERFTGSSRTDLARQMAQSWIDAKVSMSDTFAAIKGDYQEMIKTMVVEGAASRVIENALNPMLDAMSEKLKENDIEGATAVVSDGMDDVLSQADAGMEILWKSLEEHGYNMKELLSDADSEYSGIAKSISGATSEEINNVAAIGNTLMYYVSSIPRIDENLARVVALIEQNNAGASSASNTGWTDWQQQAMDNYIAIQRNTADTVVECRRAADACEKMTRLIKTKGSTSGLNVFLNS